MSQTGKSYHIQVKLPGTDCLRAFPLNADTRFGDIFRTLIAKGPFTAPQNEHAVWVLLCGDHRIWSHGIPPTTLFSSVFPSVNLPLSMLLTGQPAVETLQAIPMQKGHCPDAGPVQQAYGLNGMDQSYPVASGRWS